ncbi:M20/M25/M40 family metallo-hydrolase [Sphingosinicella soli]|uniref:Acetylornithine deacetylase/succinyl-diaminopimelate desuccinylase-like protein n=1 Tax=Sphingosinicella soli TaxID=333708 RepID=A0A7W7B2F9_9SPHN|nr:M20/M25/M40 family metallo-hydrolase [Sphingosinicella soli]MBB4632772.1 acetylornithine deacetylase/succinyl-diaminopimelate desuccinylase-like protein [Sphingosinicella soli]
MLKIATPFVLAGLIWSTTALAAAPAQVESAKAMLGRSVAFATVAGRGQVPAYAAYLADELKTAGFKDSEISIEPLGETASLILTWKGTGKKKPIVLNAHMDVVEAKREDWERDPFVMAEDGGYLFGRGTSDNKFDVVMIVQTLMSLKREGFKPSRDIVLFLTGDEETAQKTVAAIAPRYKDAAMVLNGDGGGGTLGADGKPLYYTMQTAEKTYADYKLTVTDPGGHSSAPRAENAILELGAALKRIADAPFPPETSETTRAYFAASAKRTPGEAGEAMARFGADPADTAAADILAKYPEHIGQTRTTCVPTMVSGGHAENALPQRAVANINCRIFPGTAPEAVRERLQQLAGAKVVVTLPEPFPQSSTSPLLPELDAALRKAVDGRAKGLSIIPSMSAGTTDSLFFRASGIPSYGVSGLFMKPEDEFAHGLNERVPADAISPALDHYRTLIATLAR